MEYIVYIQYVWQKCVELLTNFHIGGFSFIDVMLSVIAFRIIVFGILPMLNMAGGNHGTRVNNHKENEKDG